MSAAKAYSEELKKEMVGRVQARRRWDERAGKSCWKLVAGG